MRIGRWIVLGLGAAAAFLFWRSQQARDKVTQTFDSAQNQWQQANTASTPGSTRDISRQPGASPTPPATTTRLSQTNPDAGVSTGGSATLASDESSFAQPVVRPLDQQSPSAQAGEPTSSRSEQHDATVDNVIASAHQPESTEVSESSAQTSAPASAAAQSMSASDMTVVPGDDPDAGQLMADGDDRTITDRIRSRLGQELDHKYWGHLNINTQAMGEVYLRGYVVSDELRSRIEQLVAETEGVQSVVNELNIEEQSAA